jgi:hypothetical protein
MGLRATSLRIAGRGAGLAAALATLAAACSSSTSGPNPPLLGPCSNCGGPVGGAGGSSAQGDGGGPTDSSTVVVGEGGTCAGASEIFSTALSSCATCVAEHCCVNATSCPNDPACTAIAVCVVQSCLANDPSCLPTCEGAAETGTITEYIDFQQCVGADCSGCPSTAGPDM